MNIAIITDAWSPQINGVVSTYKNIIEELKHDHLICVINPYEPNLKRVPLTIYKEIEVVINPWKIKKELEFLIHKEYLVHIATEGPLGLYARLFLEKNNYPFTTCYHSKFPEFIGKRSKLPPSFFYPYFKWFHGRSKCVMVPTKGMHFLLSQKGFKNLKVWTRGVNTDVFNPSRKEDKGDPFILCVSRISKEKNLEKFCELNYPRKVLIGDGPQLSILKNKYPEVEFLGTKTGIELASWYASAEAFVFPSLEDTFGIVILESIACGTPVAAYPEPGPLEVLGFNTGRMDNDLQFALDNVLWIKDRETIHRISQQWTWKKSADNFVDCLAG